MTSAEPAGVRVSSSDVGHRVVVRRVLAEGGFGDLLGELVQWDDEVLVQDRHGTVHAVRRTEVVLAKRVPPAPARRG